MGPPPLLDLSGSYFFYFYVILPLVIFYSYFLSVSTTKKIEMLVSIIRFSLVQKNMHNYMCCNSSLPLDGLHPQPSLSLINCNPSLKGLQPLPRLNWLATSRVSKSTAFMCGVLNVHVIVNMDKFYFYAQHFYLFSWTGNGRLFSVLQFVPWIRSVRTRRLNVIDKEG